MSNINQRIRFLEADAKHHDVKSSSIMMVSTRTVLAIAEAFRELEQRAEASEDARLDIAAGLLLMQQRAESAEAAIERESDIHIDTAASMREWRLRAEAAEAKLAEIPEEKDE